MNAKSVKINSKRKFVGLQYPNKHYRNTRPVNALKCYIKVFLKVVSTYLGGTLVLHILKDKTRGLEEV